MRRNKVIYIIIMLIFTSQITNTTNVQATIETTRRDALGLFMHALQDPQSKWFQCVYDGKHPDSPDATLSTDVWVLAPVYYLNLYAYIDFEGFKEYILKGITPTGILLDTPYNEVPKDKWDDYTADVYWPWDAIRILTYLGLDYTQYLNSTYIVELFKSLQNSDGGFKQYRKYDTLSSTFYTYYALAALNALNKLDEFNLTKILSFVMSCYDPEYGTFGEYGPHSIDIAFTYYGLECLAILHKLDYVNRTKIIEFVKLTIENYDDGTSSFFETVASTLTGLQILSILNALDEIDVERYVRFILKCQRHQNGGFSYIVDDTVSYLGAVYYAVEALKIVSRLDVMNEKFELNAVPTYVPYTETQQGGIVIPNVDPRAIQIITLIGVLIITSWKILENKKKIKSESRMIT